MLCFYSLTVNSLRANVTCKNEELNTQVSISLPLKLKCCYRLNPSLAILAPMRFSLLNILVFTELVQTMLMYKGFKWSNRRSFLCSLRGVLFKAVWPLAVKTGRQNIPTASWVLCLYLSNLYSFQASRQRQMGVIRDIRTWLCWIGFLKLELDSQN